MGCISIILLILIIILLICIIGGATYTTCSDSFKRKRYFQIGAQVIEQYDADKYDKFKSKKGGNNQSNKFKSQPFQLMVGVNGAGENTFTNTPDTSGWQLYMRKGCPHCTHQKAELKGGFSNYIEYAPNGQILENNIVPGQPVLPFSSMTGFPMWYNYITGDKKMGKQRDMCDLTPTPSGC